MYYQIQHKCTGSTGSCQGHQIIAGGKNNALGRQAVHHYSGWIGSSHTWPGPGSAWCHQHKLLLEWKGRAANFVCRGQQKFLSWPCILCHAQLICCLLQWTGSSALFKVCILIWRTSERKKQPKPI